MCIRDRLKIAKAQQEEARLAFQQALLNAGSEVNNALTQVQVARGKTELREPMAEKSSFPGLTIMLPAELVQMCIRDRGSSLKTTNDIIDRVEKRLEDLPQKLHLSELPGAVLTLTNNVPWSSSGTSPVDVYKRQHLTTAVSTESPA